MPGTLLIQLPLNGIAAFEPTGNTPLAAGMLAAASGLPPDAVMDREETDSLGDRALVEAIARRDPDIVGFTLYSWNAERSVHIASGLRRAVPEARLVAGGPEVQSDNGWLIEADAFDLLVCGEGEPLAGILSGDQPFPSGRLIESGFQDFVPGRFPDPWLSGVLSAGGDDSIMTETVRGCPSGCLYCSYRRRHPVARIMKAPEALSLIRKLAALGGSELVFIDPTFNARPDFIELLEGMEGMGINCFAELRGEGIDGRVAGALKRAGFGSVELGLQTSDSRVLSLCGRPSDPGKVVRAAATLLENGVDPVVDIILGLPGDNREGPVEAARMLMRAGAGGRVQTFYLSALPGTELRSAAAGHGISFMDRPPYYVLQTPWGGVEEMDEAREEISDILGYDADLAPRPLLVEGWPGDERVDLDRDGDPTGPPPSFRHGTLTLVSNDLWSHRLRIRRLVERRIAADPYCVLDVILVPGAHFPVDLPGEIRDAARCSDYSSRTALRHGYDGNLRVCTLLEDFTKFNPAWLDGLTDDCAVVADVDSPDLLPGDLRRTGVGARLPGTGWDLAALASATDDPLSIHFRSQLLEKLWCSIHLGSE